ncbi:MAG: hypothetical protein QXL76_00200 [Candidatus Rehaiarchaeum fermentans]|nr:hypothetical protein [Candidatus Rehaiarchaeum fermentans]
MNKFSKIRSQAATEYLMTYGWAFLIIAIVAAILISLGVFRPSTSNTISGFSPLSPQSVSCLSASVNGLAPGLYMSFVNTASYNMNVTAISFSSVTGLTITNSSVLYVAGSASSASAASSSPTTYTGYTVPSGATFYVYMPKVSCSASTFSASVTITYVSAGPTNTGLAQSASGTISGTATS